MTHPLPTKPGFYWAKRKNGAPKEIVWVRSVSPNDAPVLRFGYTPPFFFSDFIWLSGPLEPPR